MSFQDSIAYRKFTTDCFSAGWDRILSSSTLPSPGLMNAPKKERTGQRLVEESAHCAPGLPQAVTACLPACHHSLISSAALPKTKGVNAILNTQTRQTPFELFGSVQIAQFRMASVSFFTPGEENSSEDQEESHRNPGLSAPYEVILRSMALNNLSRFQFSRSSKRSRWRRRCPGSRGRRARPPTVYPLAPPSLRSK